MSAMLTQKDVSDNYGPIPKEGTRLPTPAAHLVASTLSTCMPELSTSAGKVIAQHLHKAALHNPHKGTAEALQSVADDFGLVPTTFRGPDLMERAVVENHPLPSFLNEARRLTRGEKCAPKHTHRPGIHHMKDELHAAAADEARDPLGGFDFGAFARKAGSFAQKAAASPVGQMAAQAALQKLMGGGKLTQKEHMLLAEGGFDFGAFARKATGFAQQAAASPIGQTLVQAAMQKAMGGGVLTDMEKRLLGVGGGEVGGLNLIDIMKDVSGHKGGNKAKKHKGPKKSSLYGAFLG